MGTSRKIYIIHAKDADQHLRSLKHILENPKMGNRIAGSTPIKNTTVEEVFFRQLPDGNSGNPFIENLEVGMIDFNIFCKQPGTPFRFEFINETSRRAIIGEDVGLNFLLSISSNEIRGKFESLRFLSN